MSEVSVRLAVAADRRALCEVQVAGWKAGYAGLIPQDYLDGLRAEDCLERWEWVGSAQVLPQVRLWVAEDSSGVCGFLGLGPGDAEPVSELPWWELRTLYVHPRAWGTGAADALLTTMLEALPEPRPPVFLWMLEGNVRAARFYGRWGFKPAELETFVVAGLHLPHRRMVRAAGR